MGGEVKRSKEELIAEIQRSTGNQERAADSHRHEG